MRRRKKAIWDEPERAGYPFRFLLCPECRKRGLRAYSAGFEYRVEILCRYCKLEKVLESHEFWWGIYGRDPEVNAEQARRLKVLNDGVKELMAKTGATRCRFKRISPTERAVVLE